MTIRTLSMAILFCTCSLLPAAAAAQSEKIEANSSTLPIDITSTDTVSIAISYPDAPSVQDYDWWVAVTTPLPAPDHLFFFDGVTWTQELSVAYQRPLAATDAQQVLSISGLPAGRYTFYFGTDSNPNGVVDTANLTFDSVDVVVAPANPLTANSCGNSKQLFSVDPLDDDAYLQIDPLGATNPSGHTFPTVHTYMMLSDNSQARNVYAPGVITITQIHMVENLTNGGTDYSLKFSACPEVSGYFDHLSGVNQELAAQLNEFDSCQQYVAGTDEYRFCSKFVDLDFTPGSQLGTAGGAGGQLSAALDFGLRDSRITPLFYANPERLVASDQFQVVCPYDYYVPGPVHSGLLAKLANARSDPPLCGTVALDVADSAQGRWYLAGSTDDGEADHIALVPSNKAPAGTGVLSIGNSDIGIDAYYFDYQDSGTTNRAFDAVLADDTIYCWDTLRNREQSIASGSGQAIGSIIYLQMTDSSTLILQRSTQHTSCPADSSTLLFDGNAVQFQR